MAKKVTTVCKCGDKFTYTQKTKPRIFCDSCEYILSTCNSKVRQYVINNIIGMEWHTLIYLKKTLNRRLLHHEDLFVRTIIKKINQYMIAKDMIGRFLHSQVKYGYEYNFAISDDGELIEEETEEKLDDYDLSQYNKDEEEDTN